MRFLTDLVARLDAHENDLAVSVGQNLAAKVSVVQRQLFDVFVELSHNSVSLLSLRLVANRRLFLIVRGAIVRP
jgi:hypothetical protein